MFKIDDSKFYTVFYWMIKYLKLKGGELTIFAIIFGENMMYINIFRLINSKIHVPPTDKVSAVILQDQRHNALICG